MTAPLNGILAPTGSGGGVTGLSSAAGGIALADNKVVRGDGTTGIQGSVVEISDAGGISTPQGGSLTMANVLGGNFVVNTAGTLYAITGASATQWQMLAENDTWLRLGSGKTINWNSATSMESGALDIGLARASAGVAKITDGSTGVRGYVGGGTAVASAAALPLPTGRVFHVTGTTNITSMTATNLQSGVVVTLIFDDVLTFTDGNNLKLAGNFVTTADDTITLAFDGTNFYEVCRSVN